ncbi:hypothetical protein GCM10011507_34610 [Edaphobacter acidisoli]|uniref:Uncharacterized protein n=1 Tax=Edaphobacter acidisoli TaxID=2040573 RepID=A0A916S263_9BACT|nr:hypothetical protein [Edaphobacter acidisoli]GGA80455.1 hypothetical protein GCM10011507_34610 [Edaphobacter acidisoli]
MLITYARLSAGWLVNIFKSELYCLDVVSLGVVFDLGAYNDDLREVQIVIERLIDLKGNSNDYFPV